VRWVSRDDETADHDLVSLDDDGQPIHIEVKSTDAADPAEPFLIASKEPRFAARHRSRCYIYRLTRVRDARPAITRYKDPIGLWQEGEGGHRRDQARMWLPGQDPDDTVSDAAPS
jgi:hypothetical protein